MLPRPRCAPAFAGAQGLRPQQFGDVLGHPWGTPMPKPGYVYIMANRRNGTIYVGVTSLVARAYQHRNGLVDGFTRDHGCTLLVWDEAYEHLDDARLRELRIKKWNRQWKLTEIERRNPDWVDLYPTICG
jgi:putative endonuclease